MRRLLCLFLLVTGISIAKGNALDNYNKMDTSYQGLLQDKMEELKKANQEKNDQEEKTASSSGFDTSFLFASLFWGTIAIGYFMWGKNSQRPEAMIIAVIIGICSYLCGALVMSLISITLIFCLHYFDIRL